MSKRILREIRIDEISAVDKPAMKGARALLMKRADDDLAKTAFTEMLTELDLEQSVMDACRELYEMDEALRRSVKEIVENPQKYPDPVRALKESLGSFATAVTTMVANVTMDVGKRLSPAGRQCMAEKAAAYQREHGKKPPQEVIQAHMVECQRVTKAESKTDGGKQFPASDYAYVPDADQPSTWKLRLTSSPGGDPDPRIVGAAVAALGPGFRGQKVQIPDTDRKAVIARVRRAWLSANADKTRDDLPEVLKRDSEEDDMSKELEAQLAQARQFGELNDAEKTLYKKLSEADQAKFLALSGSERAAELEKRNAADAVVFTAADGTVYRKSDDARLIAMAKRTDEAETAARTAVQAQREADLTKRANELTHLPGTIEVRTALVRAVDSIQDEALRKSALEALQAQNASMAKAFETRGVSVVKNDEGTPAGRLEKRVQEYAKEKKLTHAQAYDEVLKTDEGRRLYAATVQA